jgi:hypothetical protein
LEKLKSGHKSMIIRGAAGRKLPHGRVNPGEVLCFVETAAMGWYNAARWEKGI